MHYYYYYYYYTSAEHYARFSHYRKLVKIALKTERLRWLKSVDSNPRTQLKQFGNTLLNLKIITILSPKLNLATTLLRSLNSLWKPLRTIFQIVFLIFPLYVSSL
jgi:hypothetical protein